MGVDGFVGCGAGLLGYAFSGRRRAACWAERGKRGSWVGGKGEGREGAGLTEGDELDQEEREVGWLSKKGKRIFPFRI